MAQRRRRTKRRPLRTTRRRYIKKRTRAKKGVRRVAQAMRVTPAQRKKLNVAMRDFERQINALTRKYNQILNHIAKL